MAKQRSKPQSKKKKTQQKTNNKEQMWFAIAAVVLAVLAIIIFSGGGNSAPTAEINTATAYQKFTDGAFMLDVRTPEEWVEYHVDGATLIPLDELEARVNEVPRDREIIVICNSGNRSQVGRDTLLDAGFTNVSSIAGGIQGWMSAGHDFVTGE